MLERVCATTVLLSVTVLMITDLLTHWSPLAARFHWSLGWVLLRYCGMLAACVLAADVLWVQEV